MKKNTSAAALAVLVSLVTIEAPSARGLCLSDDELRAVLIDMTNRSLGATLGVCIRKYPELTPDAMKTMTSYESKYGKEMTANEQVTIEIFNRRGDGSEQREATYMNAERAAINKTEAFSLKQCRDAITGMQLIVDADSFSIIQRIAAATFSIERANIPRCAEPASTTKSSDSLEEQIKAHNAKVIENTKKRCLMPKASRLSGLGPLDAAIFDTKCEQLGILPE
jgi:hypothetical protein